MSTEVGGKGVQFSPTNAGELADYTITVVLSEAYAVDDRFVIYFPSEFDMFVGSVEALYETEPGTLYLECESATLGATSCTVEHGRVTVIGSNAVDRNTPIYIILKNVVNPPAVETGSFKIAHLASNGSYKTYTFDWAKITPTAQPTAWIPIRSITATSVDTYAENVNYTFRMYPNSTVSV
jgi:hypothetical protein